MALTARAGLTLVSETMLALGLEDVVATSLRRRERERGDTEFDNPKTLAASALGLVLFIITLGLNLIALRTVRKYRERY